MKQKEDNKEQTKANSILKKVMIVISIIIIIAAIIGISILIKNNLEEYKVEEVTEFLYFTLYQNQKYGVIDKGGNIIVNPEYDMIAIPNPSKAVFVCYYDYDSEKEEYKTKVYNDKNEQLFLEYEEVLPLMFQDSTSKVPYEKSVLKYKQDGKYGLIDYYGAKITEPIYSSIESILYKEGYLIAGNDEKYGVINGKGKNILDIEYDSITADGYYNKDSKYALAGFIVGTKTENSYQYGYINYKGKIILEPKYNEINRITEIEDTENIYLLAFENGQAGIYKNKKCIIEHQYEDIEFNSKYQLFLVQRLSRQGILDIQANIIIDPLYDNIFISGDKIITQKGEENYFFDMEGNKIETEDKEEIIATSNENYFITIDENEKYGVINKEKEVLINNQYEYLEYAYGDYFIANSNGKIGVINTLNETKIDFSYDVIQKIENSNVLQSIIIKDNIIDLYNKNIEKVASMKDAVIYNKTDYIKIVSNTDFNYFDIDGNQISNTQVLKDNSLYAYKQNEKWGFADLEGQVKIEPIYDIVTEFNSYGFAGIKQDEKWGVINSNGEVILEPSYTIEWQDPEFIGKYCKVNFGYGLDYYTDDLIN